MIIIREYQSDYLKDITRLFNLWDDQTDRSEQSIKNSIIYYQNRTSNKLFLAFDGEYAVGYIFVGECAYLGYEPFLEIIQIMITPEYRGKHIGTKMMDYICETYSEMGIKEIRLHSRLVLTDAHKFYEKYGFKTMKDSRFFKLNI